MFFFHAVLFFVLDISVVLAQDQMVAAQWKPRDKDICKLNSNRVALVDDFIFVLGGRIKLRGPGEDGPRDDSSLTRISLRDDKNASSLLDHDNIFQTDPPSDVPINGAGRGFWHDTTSLYAVSGVEEETQIWAYNATEENWQQKKLADSSLPIVSNDTGSFVSASQLPLLFSSSASGGSAQFMQLNTSAGRPLQIDDLPLPGSNASILGPSRVNASVFYVPVGEEGLLLFVGGNEPSGAGDAISMSSIDVYEVKNRQWYNVATPKDPKPEPRRSFCGWVNAAQDFSSYSLTIYGGRTPSSQEAYNDLWTLSLPSFQWIKAAASPSFEEGRYSHTCLNYGQSSGLVVGGNVFGSGIKVVNGDEGLDLCSDDSTSVITVLNLTTLEFQQSISGQNKDEPYRLHPAIVSVIGGDANGGATLSAPQQALQSIFSTRATPPPPPPAPTSTSTAPAGGEVTGIPSTPGSTSQPSFGSAEQQNPGVSVETSSGSPDYLKAIIAGSVVGGIVLIAIICTVLFFYCQRRRRREQAPTISFPSKSEASDRSTRDFWDQTPPTRADRYTTETTFITPQHAPDAPRGRFVSLHAASDCGTTVSQFQRPYRGDTNPMPNYSPGTSRVYMRDELDSPSSSYSGRASHGHAHAREREYHDGGLGISRSRSDVSSISPSPSRDRSLLQGGNGNGSEMMISPVGGSLGREQEHNLYRM